ncbi:hypothetical protein ACN38_g12923 [Penicillium nordicum]|uniref:Mid2 domain-containing protein n=1 Tax=Penicillium nordicum TaxID=229535 RepID=A0A0M8NWJ6_9EURO|nr:hypothetical protein ACN38_g12923 [Penicillium nordicum]
MTSEPPKPTEGFQFHRRDDLETVTRVLTDAPVCGFFTDRIGPDNMAPYDCDSDYSCVYHMSNTAFPGLVGCCSDNDCGFTSTCYNSAKVSATPSITSGNTAFALFCTESTATECATFTWGGEDLTDYHCYSTPFIYAVYTTATFGTPTNGSMTMVTQYITKIGDDILNTYASSFDVSTSAQATATTTAHPPAGDSGKSRSSRSSGTIAGGVVGAVAGCACIGAGVILFLRKKKKSRQQDQSNELGQNGYQSVPEDQSSQNDRKLHAEVEANDPCQKIAEVEASDPRQKIAEVPGDSSHNVPQEVDSKTFIAELPADRKW